MLKKTIVILMALALCVGSVFAQGGAEGTGEKSYTVNVASTFAAEGPIHEVLTNFKAELEEATNGRIKVVIHPSGALGGVREVCEGLKAGTIEMGAIAFEDLTYYAPEYSILEAPYLFRDLDHFINTMNTLGEEIFEEIEPLTGSITAAWVYRGSRMVTANKPIYHPSDLKGLKFRLPSMQDRIAVFEALGASPTIVDFTELYMAMKTGTVDAEENPPETIYSYKYYECQKYLMLTSHVYAAARYTISSSWFKTISEADQELILKTWKSAAAKVSEKYPDPDQTYIALLKEAGMEVIEPDKSEFMEIAAPVIAEYNEKNWKPGLMERIQSL